MTSRQEDLIAARTLADFSNISNETEAEYFRNNFLDFVPPAWWKVNIVVSPREEREKVWQYQQRRVREAWPNKFPLDTSIKLISAGMVPWDIHWKQEQMNPDLGQHAPQAINVVSLTMEPDLTAQEEAVWPYMRAVMFLTLDRWRARFCPRCGKRFVAAKSNSTYCTDACFNESRKDKKNAWWSEHGEDWRAKGSKKRKAKEK